MSKMPPQSLTALFKLIHPILKFFEHIRFLICFKDSKYLKKGKLNISIISYKVKQGDPESTVKVILDSFTGMGYIQWIQ